MANDGTYNPYQYQSPDYLKNLAGWNQEQHNTSTTGYVAQNQQQVNQIQYQQTAQSGYTPQNHQWRQDYSSYPYQRAGGAQRKPYQQERSPEPITSTLSRAAPATRTESTTDHPKDTQHLYNYLQ